MQQSLSRSVIIWIVAGLCQGVSAVLSYAGVISPDLQRALGRRGTHADTAVIVRFSDPLDLAPFAVTDRRARDNRLLLALKARAARNRSGVAALLATPGASHFKGLWMVNAMAFTVPAVTIGQMVNHPDVARIDLDSFVQGGRSQRTPPSRNGRLEDVPDALPQETALPPAMFRAKDSVPGWNLAALHVPEVWAFGATGKGMVVATMDTGADLIHPDLRKKWRGGTNSWFDPHGEEALPYDALGHGTQALGVIVGGSAIGIAPDAQWIAVRLYNSNGRTSMSDIHLAFQWLLDPDGDPATLDTPDVVNASWALAGRGAGACIMEFSEDIHALKSAGIAVVFAAGNEGPASGTSNSPGNNPGALSVGAIDSDMKMARQTSRGPSACDGMVFPRLWAPGVNVRTTDLSHGGMPSYTNASGSSLAAPHVTGVLALLASAYPAATVAELEAAILRATQPLDEAQAGPRGSHGRVDALAAFNVLRDAKNAALQSPATLGVGRQETREYKP